MRIQFAFSLAVLLACEPRTPAADSATDAGPTSAAASVHASIEDSAIGGIRLGMSLDSVRRVFPSARFERTEDGAGVPSVAVILGNSGTVIAWLDEANPVGPVDFTQTVKQLETFDSTFVTREGVRVGSLVTDVEKVYGATKEITLSELESRQYIEFVRQPAYLQFRLDYSGDFPAGARTTTRYATDARIFSIALSHP